MYSGEFYQKKNGKKWEKWEKWEKMGKMGKNGKKWEKMGKMGKMGKILLKFERIYIIIYMHIYLLNNYSYLI